MSNPEPATNPGREQWADRVNALPPTEYLIMDVLGARHRTGEGTWTFPSRLTPALRRLETADLIWWKSGPVDRTCLVGLTDNGRLGVLSPTYTPPNAVQDQELAGLRAALTEARTTIKDLATTAVLDASADLVTAAARVTSMGGKPDYASPAGQRLLDRLQDKTAKLRTVLGLNPPES
ncbi:MAG: hypothetical protein ACOH1Y_09850 [Propionicimonas sp.]